MKIEEIYNGNYLLVWEDGGDYIYVKIASNDPILILKEDWEKIKKEFYALNSKIKSIKSKL